MMSVTLLLLAVGLYFHYSAASGRHAGKSRMCCVEVTTRNVSNTVVGETYREQAEKLPCVKAIIFKTASGKVCADPEAEWVQNLIPNMRKE